MHIDMPFKDLIKEIKAEMDYILVQISDLESDLDMDWYRPDYEAWVESEIAGLVKEYALYTAQIKELQELHALETGN